MLPRCAVRLSFDPVSSTLASRRSAASCVRGARSTLSVSASTPRRPHRPSSLSFSHRHLHSANTFRTRPQLSLSRRRRTYSSRTPHQHPRASTSSVRVRAHFSRRSFASASASPSLISNDDLFSTQSSSTSSPPEDTDTRSPEGRLHQLTKQHSFLCDEADRFFEKTESAADHVWVTEKHLSEESKKIDALEKDLESVAHLPDKVAQLKTALDGSDRFAEDKAKRQIAERLAWYFWKIEKFDRITLQNIVFSILADPSLKPAGIWNYVLKAEGFKFIELTWMTERVRGVEYTIDLSMKAKWLGEFEAAFHKKIDQLQQRADDLEAQYEVYRPKFEEARRRRDEFANIVKTELAAKRTDLGEAQRNFESIANSLRKIAEKIEQHCELYEIPLPELREGRGAQSDQEKVSEIMTHLSELDKSTMQALTKMGKVTEVFELQQGTPKSDVPVVDDINDDIDEDDTAGQPEGDDVFDDQHAIEDDNEREAEASRRSEE